MRVTIVVPTYNEAASIEALLGALFTLDLDAELAVVVADDHSPDGTAALASGFAGGRVLVSEGDKRGLGAAYRRGFDVALRETAPDVVVQMDADLSHDPADVVRLVDALRGDDCDVVIGSRYVTGGSLDASWSRWRRALSRGGNLIARYVAGLWDVRDCTAGFKAIRASVLSALKFERLWIQGYAFQVALLHALLLSGARVREIPIHFRDRAAGSTKLGWRDVLEFVVHVWWLRVQSAATFLRFAAVGLSGVVVNLGLFALLLALGVHKYVASPVAVESAIIWNFFWNNYWTFSHRDLTGRTRIRGLKFNLVSFVTLGINFATFVSLSVLFPDAAPVLLQAAAILPSTAVNYFANSYWTFRDGH